MANERGSWGASCYLEEECGTWLACDGGAGSVGGKCMILDRIKINNFFFLVTEGTCRPKGWAIGGGAAVFLFVLLMLSFCLCFCCRLRRRRRESRRGSEGSLVVF